MSPFAKTFDSEKYGQILVMKDQSDDESAPQINVFIDGHEFGLGLCSVGPTWPDTDEGWEKRDETFDKADLDFAERFAGSLHNQMKELMA